MRNGNNGGCKNGFNSKHRNGKESILKQTDFLPIALFRDSEGRKFLHYCIYSGHPSILGSIKAKKCEKRGCFNYARLYLEKKDYL